MNPQPDLFDHRPARRYPERAGHKEGTTSKAAASAIDATLNERQTEVMAALRGTGIAGLTPDEAADKLGRTVLAVRPRFSELNKLGRIERTGERRANASGLKAAVWRAKEGR